MLILFVETGCPYCKKVLTAGKLLGLTFNLKNIADPGIGNELIKLGGKRQVPFLVDKTNGTKLYESTKIVNYLNKNY